MAWKNARGNHDFAWLLAEGFQSFWASNFWAFEISATVDETTVGPEFLSVSKRQSQLETEESPGVGTRSFGDRVIYVFKKSGDRTECTKQARQTFRLVSSSQLVCISADSAAQSDLHLFRTEAQFRSAYRALEK